MNTSTLSRAEQACAELAASAQPVTFTAVADRTGIGRATLYWNPAIRAVIDQHRQQAASATALAGLAADIAPAAIRPVTPGSVFPGRLH